MWCFLSLIVLVPHKDFPFMTLTQYLKSTGDFTSELKSLLCGLSTKYGHLDLNFSIWRNLSESLSSFSSRLTPKVKYQYKYSFVLDYFVEVIEQGERALHSSSLVPGEWSLFLPHTRTPASGSAPWLGFLQGPQVWSVAHFLLCKAKDHFTWLISMPPTHSENAPDQFSSVILYKAIIVTSLPSWQGVHMSHPQITICLKE